MKVTEAQRTKMVEYLIENKVMVGTNDSSIYTTKDLAKKWQALGDILNSMQGPAKEWKVWRKTWHDFYTRVKQKVANIKNKEYCGTGSDCVLNKLDKMIQKEFISPVDPPSFVPSYKLEESIEFEVHSPQSTLAPLPSSCKLEEETEKTFEFDSVENDFLPSSTSSKSKKRKATATEDYTKYLKKKLEIKENYYKKKIEYMKIMADVAAQTLSLKKQKYRN